MSIYWWPVVIFVTALVSMIGSAILLNWWTDRTAQTQPPRQSPAPPLPGELPHAGYLPVEGPFDLPAVLLATGPYGPFPVDTGPMLILSEQAAANVALEREIRQRCAEAEAKIPPRWR